MTDAGNPDAPWPTLPPYSRWRETCEALHLWSQIVGKYRLAHTPWVNHSWHATLYVTPRGLTTGMIHDDHRAITLSFDFHDHRLVAQADSGATGSFPLEPMSVAEFFSRTRDMIEGVGGSFQIYENPSELPDPVPFPEGIPQCATTMRPPLSSITPRWCRFIGSSNISARRFSGR